MWALLGGRLGATERRTVREVEADGSEAEDETQGGDAGGGGPS